MSAVPYLYEPQQKPTPAKLLTLVAAERMRRGFSLFAKRAWHVIEPQRMHWNWHMDAICEHLAYVTMEEIRFLMICIPPRMSKSLLASVIWPAWHWTHNPGTQFISASYESNLSLEHASLSRRLIESPWYRQFYGHEYYLLADANEKHFYRNSAGGFRDSTSVNGRTTGHGGNTQLLDDAHNAKQVESDTIRRSAIEWHDNSWRSRLNNPNTAQKVYIGQRTHDHEIYGHVLEREGKRWVLLEMPMEHDPKRICITYPNDGTGVKAGAVQLYKDPRKVAGELLNPSRFNAATATAEKEMMSHRAWMAQYQQQPEGQGGLILKRHWWKQWVWPDWHPSAGKERPLPNFFEIIQVYDTAFEKDEESDFSARTTWGLFYHRESEKDERGRTREGKERIGAMMLDMMCERLSFPELRQEMIVSDEEFAPDKILIEKKASGHSLIHEGRRKGLPIKGIKLTDGGDLVARIHMASLMLEKGCIFYCPRAWAMRVIESAVKFPNGDHDDIEATLAIAWQYMRRYYDLTLPDDDEKNPDADLSPFAWQKMRYA